MGFCGKSRKLCGLWVLFCVGGFVEGERGLGCFGCVELVVKQGVVVFWIKYSLAWVVLLENIEY